MWVREHMQRRQSHTPIYQRLILLLLSDMQFLKVAWALKSSSLCPDAYRKPSHSYTLLSSASSTSNLQRPNRNKKWNTAHLTSTHITFKQQRGNSNPSIVPVWQNNMLTWPNARYHLHCMTDRCASSLLIGVQSILLLVFLHTGFAGKSNTILLHINMRVKYTSNPPWMDIIL